MSRYDARKAREPDYGIPCECCHGFGSISVFDYSAERPQDFHRAEVCPLCGGDGVEPPVTGREPSAVHPRREGEKK